MAKQNLSLYRGTTYNMTYTHVEPMTGGTLYFTVKAAKYDSDDTDTSALIKKDVTSFSASGDDTDTYATWKLTDSDMYIDPGKYYYDITFEAANGDSTPPIFEGQFKVLPQPNNRQVP